MLYKIVIDLSVNVMHQYSPRRGLSKDSIKAAVY